MAAEEPQGARVVVRTLIAPVLLGAALRAGLAWLVFPVGLRGDEHYYREVAFVIATQGRHFAPSLNAWSQWPPAHSFWLSRFIDADLSPLALHTASTLGGLLVAEWILGVAIVFAGGWVMVAALGPRAGRIGAFLLACDPMLVAYSVSLFSVNSLLAFTLTGVAFALEARRRGSLGWAIGAGLVFGGAGLSREIGLLFGAWAGLCLVFVDRRPGLRQALAMGLAMAAIVLPWTLRNHQVHDRLVPVSSVGWMAIRIGNTLHPERWLEPNGTELAAFQRRWFSLRDEMERADLSRREAIAAIAAEQPLWLPKKLVRNTAHLFSLDNLIFKRLRDGEYGHPSLSLVRVVVLGVLAWLAGTMGLAAWAARSRREWSVGEWMVLGMVPITLALHIFANASSRYALPMTPAILLLAARALAEPRAPLRSRAAAVVASVWMVFFFVVALPYDAGRWALPLWREGVENSPAAEAVPGEGLSAGDRSGGAGR